MDCTKLTQKCPQTDNCCLQHLEEIIKYTATLFEEFQINYWIDYNTLRGALEKRVYAEENAISYATLDYEKILSLAYRIYEDGYFLTTAKRENGNSWLRMHYSYNNLLSIDLLNWNTVNNIVYRKSVASRRGCNFDLKYLTPISSIGFGDAILKCPNNPTEFIKLRYGG